MELLMNYHFTYQTKNLINGKTYVGVHSTKNPNDSYIGHGIKRDSDAKRMKKNGCRSLFVLAVCKYGYKNFKREILSYFDSREDALDEEVFIVDNNWIKDENNYNTSLGGLGSSRPLTTEHLNTLKDLSSKEYLVVNLETKESWVIKNLSEFERKRYKEFSHSNDGKRILSRLNPVSRGKSLMYKDKWWVCLLSNWNGCIPTKKELIEKRRINLTKNNKVAESNFRRSKTYYFVSPDGETVKVEHLPSFCKKNNLYSANMCKVHKGFNKTHKGWSKHIKQKTNNE